MSGNSKKIMKCILYYIIIISISLFLSMAINILVIDDFFGNLFRSFYQYVIMRLIVCFALILVFNTIFQPGSKISLKNKKLMLCFSIFIILTSTIRPLYFSYGHEWVLRRVINLNVCNLFDDIISSNMGVILLIGNIVMFVPFGSLLDNVINVKMEYKLLYCIIFIMGIEVCQYIFYLGIFDVNDIILNFIGAIIGISINRLLSHVNFAEQKSY